MTIHPACLDHWARVRRGLDIEAALRRHAAETRPGHRFLAYLKLAALVVELPPGWGRLNALQLRHRLAPFDRATILRRAQAEQFYGRRA